MSYQDSPNLSVFYHYYPIKCGSIVIFCSGMPPPGFPPVPPPGSMPPAMPPSMAMHAQVQQGGGAPPPVPPPFPPAGMHPGMTQDLGEADAVHMCRRGTFDLKFDLCVSDGVQECLRCPCLLPLHPAWCPRPLLHRDQIKHERLRPLACLHPRPWACHPERRTDLPWVRF